MRFKDEQDSGVGFFSRSIKALRSARQRKAHSRLLRQILSLNCAAICVALACSLIASAQISGTGSIQGLVSDPTGSTVANAQVQAINTTTNVVTQVTTNSDGRYVLPLLLPGPYKVVVSAASFSTATQPNITVDALAQVRVDVKLSVGAAVETVTVTGEQQGLQTQDLKLGSEMSNETFDSLPLAQNNSARDPSSFIGLAVGVNSFSTQAAGPSTASFNGGQTYQSETYIEGLPVTSAGTESDTRNLAFGISVEAVEQFQVAVTGSEATYEGQGVSNFIVKSGSDKFHGGVYEFLRNTVFDSKAFFSTNGVSPEHQNEFGANLSGPILHNRLFFFANYDGYRLSNAFIPTPQTIPTLKERAGDFSEFPQKIYDPDPNACLAKNSGGACISRPQISYNGVLNVIPPSRLSKAAQSFQSYLPQPDAGSSINQNYTVAPINYVTNDSGTAKIDYNLSAAHRVFALFSRGKYANPITGSLTQPSPTANAGFGVPYLDGRSVIEYSTTGQLHEDWTIRPTLINDFGFGLSRLYIPLTSNTQSGNYPQKAGLTGLPPGIASEAFPDINFSGNNPPVSWDGTNSHVNIEGQTTFTWQDNLLWTKGKHQMTFGYQWQALQDNYNNPLTGSLAGFNFSGSETANFNSNATIDNTTGLAYASYMLGAVDSSSVQYDSVAETGGRYKTNAAYIQDNYQITPSLSINMGLRWDVWTPFTEVLDRQTFFDPNEANPVAGGILGALRFSGFGTNPIYCNCHTPVKTHYLNFGPRIGFAYKIDDKTVVRAAYGIFYAHAGGVGGRTNGRQGLSQIGFNNSGSATSSVTGAPAYYWENGVPGNTINPPFINPSYGIGNISATAPGAAAIGAGPGTAQTVTYGDPDRGGQPPQYQDFFLNVQRAFGPKTTFSIAYSGSVGRHLPGAAVNGPFTDQIPLKYLPLGALLTAPLNSTNITAAAALGFTVAAPFPNFSSTATIGQALKPYPQYNSISDPWLDVGSSSYNSLQTTLNRRVANGLTFMVNYTFSKEMDNLAGARLPGADYLEYSVGSLDHAHVLQTTWVYALPFGHGQHFNPSNFFVKALADDWRASAIVTASSGAPVSVGATCTGGGIIDGSCYPNYDTRWSGSIFINNTKPTTAADAKNTPRLAGLTKTDSQGNVTIQGAFLNPPQFTIGNTPRTAPYGLYAPHQTNVDANLRRDFPIREGIKLAFQADVFNLLNRVYFGAPNTTLSSSSYGTYGAQANQPRKYQFGGRITF
jgi:hypothetical protein